MPLGGEFLKSDWTPTIVQYTGVNASFEWLQINDMSEILYAVVDNDDDGFPDDPNTQPTPTNTTIHIDRITDSNGVELERHDVVLNASVKYSTFRPPINMSNEDSTINVTFSFDDSFIPKGYTSTSNPSYTVNNVVWLSDPLLAEPAEPVTYNCSVTNLAGASLGPQSIIGQTYIGAFGGQTNAWIAQSDNVNQLGFPKNGTYQYLSSLGFSGISDASITFYNGSTDLGSILGFVYVFEDGTTSTDLYGRVSLTGLSSRLVDVKLKTFTNVNISFSSSDGPDITSRKSHSIEILNSDGTAPLIRTLGEFGNLMIAAGLTFPGADRLLNQPSITCVPSTGDSETTSTLRLSPDFMSVTVINNQIALEDMRITALTTRVDTLEENTPEQGPKGDKGDKGDTGDAGPRGLQGLQGLRGLAGTNGTNGANGRDGAQGIQGLRGLPGVNGQDGDKGDKGDQGIQGVQGIQGSQGAQGLRGAQGEPGEPANEGNVTRNFESIKVNDRDIDDLQQRLNISETALANLTEKTAQAIELTQSIEAFYNTSTYERSELVVSLFDYRRGVITIGTKANPRSRLTVDDVAALGIRRGHSIWNKRSNPTNSGKFTVISIEPGNNGVDAVIRVSPRSGYNLSNGETLYIPE